MKRHWVVNHSLDALRLEVFAQIVTVQSRILETNGVVVAGRLTVFFEMWWLYTIYPSGQIYVAVEATARTESWSAPQLGLAVTLQSAPEVGLETYVNPEADPTAEPPVPAYATVRSKPHDAFLLYVLHDGGRPTRITESRSASDRVSLVAIADKRGGIEERWAGHLYLGSDGSLSGGEALARAVGYATPAAPKP